ncbi:MAG: hypothetical protein IKN17_06305 [Ruminococcus sp.]|nr:hypothetical protein [Ruminococcus sp.]
MQLLEVLATENSININTPEWQRAVKQLHIQMEVDVDKFDYFKCYPCKFTLKANRNAVKISERPGYFLSARQGILVICPSTTDLPLTMFVDKKAIRVVKAESKLMKSEVIITTNDDTYVFRSNKKGMQDIEKEVNKIRLI